MTQRSPRIRQARGPDKPLIVSELDRLREKPPRASKNEPLDQLERRLAILNGIRDGDAPARIAQNFPHFHLQRKKEGYAAPDGAGAVQVGHLLSFGGSLAEWPLRVDVLPGI